MRCKNCGWPNEPGVSRCVKCNAPLQGSMVDSDRQSSTQVDSDESLKSTLREPSNGGRASFEVEAQDINTNNCPNCGYPISVGISVCPACQAPLSQNGQSQSHQYNQPNSRRSNPRGGTINPWVTPAEDSFCTLKRIPWQNERVQYDPVSYSGQSIILTRANTDANNNSITSQTQAIISHENGEWFIEDKSALKTTLIRVDRKVRLEDGDVIVLGNRMFEFRKG